MMNKGSTKFSGKRFISALLVVAMLVSFMGSNLLYIGASAAGGSTATGDSGVTGSNADVDWFINDKGQFTGQPALDDPKDPLYPKTSTSGERDNNGKPVGTDTKVKYQLDKSVDWGHGDKPGSASYNQAKDNYQATVNLNASIKGSTLRYVYDVVFVVDKSGSMWDTASNGAKRAGVKAGVTTAANMLFGSGNVASMSIVTFADSVNGPGRYYNDYGSSYSNYLNLHSVADVVNAVNDAYPDKQVVGGTNYVAALTEAKSVLSGQGGSAGYFNMSSDNAIHIPMMVFFTDGQPTCSNTDTWGFSDCKKDINGTLGNNAKDWDAAQGPMQALSNMNCQSYMIVCGVLDEDNVAAQQPPCSSSDWYAAGQKLLTNNGAKNVAFAGSTNAGTEVSVRDANDSAAIERAFRQIIEDALNLQVLSVSDTLSEKVEIDLNYAKANLGWIAVAKTYKDSEGKEQPAFSAVVLKTLNESLGEDIIANKDVTVYEGADGVYYAILPQADGTTKVGCAIKSKASTDGVSVSTPLPIVVKEEYRQSGAYLNSNNGDAYAKFAAYDMKSGDIIWTDEIPAGPVYLPVGVPVSPDKADDPNWAVAGDSVSYKLKFSNYTDWNASFIDSNSNTISLLYDLLPSQLVYYDDLQKFMSLKMYPIDYSNAAIAISDGSTSMTIEGTTYKYTWIAGDSYASIKAQNPGSPKFPGNIPMKIDESKIVEKLDQAVSVDYKLDKTITTDAAGKSHVLLVWTPSKPLPAGWRIEADFSTLLVLDYWTNYAKDFTTSIPSSAPARP